MAIMKYTYQVSEVAGISGVSIRTLHYYDAIGLLVPGRRSAAGYRLYSDEDLLRLQQILINRELGLSLDAIRRMLDDKHFDRRNALLQQRAQLQQRVEQTAAMINAIDAALAALENTAMEDEKMVDMKKIFNGFDPEKYAEEAEQRWGGNEAFNESVNRTKSYTEEDWIRFREESGTIYRDAYAALKSGVQPDAPEAMAVAERHRLSIDRWFYPCSVKMHCGLADMYEADSRFAETIDKFGPGLTNFLATAIRANAHHAQAQQDW